MNDTDILVPDKKIIKIGKRDYSLGELSFIQTIKICKFIIKTIFTNKEKFDTLKKETETTTDNTQDALKILELIDEDKLPEFFGIILQENDIDFLRQELTLSTTTEIIAVLCETNDFLTLKKNINRITKVVKKGI